MIAAAGLLSMFPAGQALACHALDREIVGVESEKIGGYTEVGKFDRDLTRAEVMNKKIVACSEVNSALAKIMLSAERPVWIDLTEVKLTPTTCDESAPATIAGVATRPPDGTTVGSSGAGSCK
jgi:hypothetical protein